MVEHPTLPGTILIGKVSDRVRIEILTGTVASDLLLLDRSTFTATGVVPLNVTMPVLLVAPLSTSVGERLND
jgi:hypothetical protein